MIDKYWWQPLIGIALAVAIYGAACLVVRYREIPELVAQQLPRDMLPEGKWYYTPGVGWRCPVLRMCSLIDLEGRVGRCTDEGVEPYTCRPYKLTPQGTWR